MDVTKHRESLTDSALDRELDSALGIEPSPEFLAHVRTRIASEPEPSPWRLAVHGRVVAPLWGVAIVGIMLAIVVPQLMREEFPVTRPVPGVASTTPGYAKRAAEGTPAVADESPARTAGPRRSVESVTQLALSPVLFSDDDRNALALLVGAVEAGRVPPLPVSDTDQSHEVRELRIEPLVIEPLRQLARVPQEGEGQW